jgi:hypothetical protein
MLAVREGVGMRPTLLKPAGVPRLAFTRVEAAESLGMSVDSFERYVQPELRLVRRGKLRLVPVTELQRWLDANAERVFGGRRDEPGR